MIQNRLKILIAEKELKVGRRLTYRAIAEETGISTSTLTAYIQQTAARFDADTLGRLCKFFGVQVGDILEYIPESQ